MRSITAASDAGPLIHLSKTGLLHLLKTLYAQVAVPREVKTEVVDRGREKGSPDALLVERAITEGWIVVVDIAVPVEFAELCELAGVQRGEAAVLRYALEKKIPALLDDDAARLLGRSLRIPIRGSLGIIVEAARKRHLQRTEALEKLDELADIMYLDSDLYRTTRRSIEET